MSKEKQQQHQENKEQIVPWDPMKKHPLRHQWVLWYDQELKDKQRPSHANWGSSMKEILTISTVIFSFLKLKIFLKVKIWRSLRFCQH
jgi:hypothetical protein